MSATVWSVAGAAGCGDTLGSWRSKDGSLMTGDGSRRALVPAGFQDAVIVADLAECVLIGKPEPQIFALVVNKLGVPASECVFVDDVPAHLEHAHALGMRVIRHRSVAAPVAELESLFGVALS
jgi:putative hydrolase of the HAD superfamily